MRLREAALTGLMAAVLCIMAPLAVPIPLSPVPLSMTNLVLYLILYILGTRIACISYLVYLLIGLLGLPVFSGFTGGAGKLAGPTGGYLLGFLFMILISGWFIDRWHERLGVCIAAMLLGMALCYLFGTLWLAWQAGMSFAGAWAVGVLPFLLGDVLKILLAAFGGRQLRKRLQRAGFMNEHGR